MMQKLEGEFAESYNLRKGRSGAFWSDRFHCTMVESGEHAWNCMKYIDLNMVRAGVVAHPEEWRWCGYDELAGIRRRYRLIDLDWISTCFEGTILDGFSAQYRASIDVAVQEGRLTRDPIWTESIAVGSEEFVRSVSDEIRNRVRLEINEANGIWTVREPLASYNAFLHTKNGF
jgi:putative transposase